MQVAPHIFNMHIEDGAVAHPGGSNNYFVGDPRTEMVLVDTGDHQRVWTRSILDYHRQLGGPRIAVILVTHGHADHTGGLDRIQEALGATVRCHPKLVQRLRTMLDADVVSPLHSGEVISTGGGASLKALFTPGHEVDHVSFHLPEDGVLFTGDCVLGASSSTVRDLASYMKSLQLLTRYSHETICPAHGPVVPPPRGAQLVRWYINHRTEREEQVLAALAKGLAEPREIVREVYPRSLPRGLRHAAEGNVRTHLDKLVKEGRVAVADTRYSLKRPARRSDPRTAARGGRPPA